MNHAQPEISRRRMHVGWGHLFRRVYTMLLSGGCACLSGCSTAGLPQSAGPADFSAVALARATAEQVAGTLNVLTYNVAGLPAVVSGSNPEVNTRQVSPHLNRYDVVLAQEDFSYHDDLVHAVRHPYQVGPREADAAFVGDGLTTLSAFPLSRVDRVEWNNCSGYLFSLNDCLGEKGFSVAQVWLSSRGPVHVYNLHADAGDDVEDVEARKAGFDQLAAYIERHSSNAALIVGGDTNLDESDPRDRAILSQFLRRTGLVDTCRTLDCPRHELDRVLYRSSLRVHLQATGWSEDVAFVDADGGALSDHPAVAVRLEWRLVPPVERTGALAVNVQSPSP